MQSSRATQKVIADHRKPIQEDMSEQMEIYTTHKYGPEAFTLYGLPIPRVGKVLGLVGANRIGKSTVLKILGGKLKPNFGWLDNPPDWQEIPTCFPVSELHDHFVFVRDGNVKVVMKPQNIEFIPKALVGNVGTVLHLKDERGMMESICTTLELNQVLDRNIGDLSVGELQRFAIAVVAIQNTQMYMFDEPFTFLDVKQRLKAAQVIQSLCKSNSCVVVAEHDLAILDYLSDSICFLFGTPGRKGVVSIPFSAEEGINKFLAGAFPMSNIEYRGQTVVFRAASTLPRSANDADTFTQHRYPTMRETRGTFKLCVNEGCVTNSEIIVMLGENGTGKTTLLDMLAGHFNVSYKRQEPSLKHSSSVRNLLCQDLGDTFADPHFVSIVMTPLVGTLMDREVKKLSRGESQRVLLCLCLGKPADVYLIDEPSAYLDSQQRLVVSSVIKRFVLHAKRPAFVVEHDFVVANYLADRIIVFEGVPSVQCTAHSPQPSLSGMNFFLSRLDVTVRRDSTNYCPKFNKLNLKKDVEQKATGKYWTCLDVLFLIKNAFGKWKKHFEK